MISTFFRISIKPIRRHKVFTLSVPIFTLHGTSSSIVSNAVSVLAISSKDVDNMIQTEFIEVGNVFRIGVWTKREFGVGEERDKVMRQLKRFNRSEDSEIIQWRISGVPKWRLGISSLHWKCFQCLLKD